MEIKRLDESTLDSQINVYRQAFGKETPLAEIKEHWIKKHFHNPIESSLIFGAFENGELVGMNAYMPCCYTYKGETIYVLQSCESGVLPSQQGKGIWGKVVRYAVDYIFRETKYVAIIGFPNYRNSYPGFKKMGWKTLFQMNNMILVNSGAAFADSISHGRSAIKLLGRAGVILRIPIWFSSRRYNNAVVGDCPIDMALWDDDSSKITIDHSALWCQWKADYKNLKCVSLQLGGEIVASCIYGIDHFEGNDVVRLDKISFKKDVKISNKCALAKILRLLKKEYPSAAFVRTWTLDNNSLFKKLGFLKSFHPNPFIITEQNNMLADLPWDLSFFDLD